MKKTTISLNEKTAIILNKIKYNDGFRTVDEVIQSLIKTSKRIKNGK